MAIWLIAGLGNPGAKYDGTRHNIGFMVVDELARRFGAPSFQKSFNGLISKITVGADTLVLLKPQTFMNLSGQSVQGAMTFFKLPLERVIVVHDELDLPPGRLRVKEGGGHGGHNGLRDISKRVGGDYIRLRLGIGRPEHKGDEANHVLKPFTAAEGPVISQSIDYGADCIERMLKNGLKEAQAHFHTLT